MTYQSIVDKYLSKYSIVEFNFEKPWGGYVAISHYQVAAFIDMFFQDVDDIDRKMNLSPKLLIVEPHKRLSWQYHRRRSELWKVVEGPVGIGLSDTDVLFEQYLRCDSNQIVDIKVQERHRLIGLNERGIVAEIWRHTDRNQPSNEEDIVRVQDDFGR